MNYRRLTSEELKPLEMEFIDFLVVNGVTAPDWENIKKESIEKADQMIGLFSEVVFEGIFRKVRFLQIRTQKFVHTYQCLSEKIILTGIETKSDQVDFTIGNIKDKMNLDRESINIFMTEKKYAKKREYELFDMTQKGCEISDGQLFKTLSIAYTENADG